MSSSLPVLSPALVRPSTPATNVRTDADANSRLAWQREMERAQAATWFHPPVLFSSGLSVLSNDELPAVTARNSDEVPLAAKAELSPSAQAAELPSVSVSASASLDVPASLTSQATSVTQLSRQPVSAAASASPSNQPSVESYKTMNSRAAINAQPTSATHTSASSTSDAPPRAVLTSASSQASSPVAANGAFDNSANAPTVAITQAVPLASVAATSNAMSSMPISALQVTATLADARSLAAITRTQVGASSSLESLNTSPTAALSPTAEVTETPAAISNRPAIRASGSVSSVFTRTPGEVPVRVHTEWATDGAQVWLGVDGDAFVHEERVAGIVAGLQRSFAEQGQKLLRVICNGRVVFDAPSKNAAHSKAKQPNSKQPEISVLATAHQPNYFQET